MAYERDFGPVKVVEKYLGYDHWIRRLPRIETATDDDLPF